MYSYPASKTESSMQGALLELPYPLSSSRAAVKPETSEEKEDVSDPILDDGAVGSTSPLDGERLGSNRKARGSRDSDRPDDQEEFLRNG